MKYLKTFEKYNNSNIPQYFKWLIDEINNHKITDKTFDEIEMLIGNMYSGKLNKSDYIWLLELITKIYSNNKDIDYKTFIIKELEKFKTTFKDVKARTEIINVINNLMENETVTDSLYHDVLFYIWQIFNK